MNIIDEVAIDLRNKIRVQTGIDCKIEAPTHSLINGRAIIMDSYINGKFPNFIVVLNQKIFSIMCWSRVGKTGEPTNFDYADPLCFDKIIDIIKKLQ